MIPGWVSLITVLFIVGLIGLTLLLIEIDKRERERGKNADYYDREREG